jgi:hypothetical protein
MRRLGLVTAACFPVLAGCARAPREEKRAAAEVPERRKGVIELTSAAFGQGGVIPKKHTGEGEDVSPPLSWKGVPEGTKELALVCDDPDAPSPRRPGPEPWVHWVLYRIPAGAAGLGEGETGGGVEGVNSWPAGSPQRSRYAGPMPPPGSGAHRYFFRLYALDGELDLGPGATKKELLAAIEGHVLAEGELVGTYERE